MIYEILFVIGNIANLIMITCSHFSKPLAKELVYVLKVIMTRFE